MPYKEMFPRHPLHMGCDNLAAVNAINRGWGKSVAYLGRAVGLRLSTLGDLVAQQDMICAYVKSTEMHGDGFTKALPRLLFERWRRMICVW